MQKVAHDNSNEVLLWDIRTTAKAMGLSVYTLYAWVSQRRIPFVKAGKRTMFAPQDVRDWINSNKTQPKGPLGELN
jgi:excisionase family DNA binding protein